MSLQTNVRIIITLFFLAMLSACGASNSPVESNDLSSNGTPVSKPIATCNKASSASSSYKIAAQKTGNSFDPNWANFFLKSVPASFEAQTTFFRFFKGQATSDTAITYNTTAVPFAIYDTVAGAYLNNAQLYDSLKWSDVKNLIAGATAATFINRVIFVLSLQDPNAAYQTISLSSYNVSDNSGVEAVQALLPTFYANPSDYAYKASNVARETVLKNMHPLKNQVGDFQTLANQLCQ